MIEGDHRGYRLGAARVDVADAARLVDDAGRRLDAGTAALAAAAAGRALAVLGAGVALAGEPDADWVDALRDEVAALLRAARHLGRGGRRCAPGAPASRRTWPRPPSPTTGSTRPRTGCSCAPTSERGEPARALAAYHALAAALRDELGRRAGAADPGACTSPILREQRPPRRRWARRRPAAPGVPTPRRSSGVPPSWPG